MHAAAQKRTRTRRFKVGNWLAEPQLHELTGPSGTVAVEARSMDVLVALAEGAGDVLSRDGLLEQVWGERYVGDEALTHAIWDLRRALGDDPKTPQFIQTVHSQGYRLVAKVSWLKDGVGEQARYVLEEEIGRGAMGVVWRATDPRLERAVAVKFLSPDLCRDRESKARFLREARAEARLDHPNICTVYEVDETDDGRMYLVMPLYQGDTLRSRISDGPLPWPEAVRITAEIAAGLQVAHEAGIIHRDLKPSNVMLTAGASTSGGKRKANGGKPSTVKVLDFGLARLRGTTRLTQVGSSLGTPAYMSPELAGSEDVGPESDLWALGVMLYEMLTGRCPFDGGNDQAVIYSIVNDEPEPLPAELAVPSDLGALLDALLVKEPSQRVSDAGALAEALHEILNGDGGPVQLAKTTGLEGRSKAESWRGKGMWVGLAAGVFAVAGLSFSVVRSGPSVEQDSMAATATAPEQTSIAVLPFTNRSGDEGQEFFSDGISEELLNLLARIPELRVISRTSAFSFKGQNLRVPEIAERLNVAHVLEGSVRRDGDRVRITAQMIEADTDTPLWSETYNRTLEDIFAIQEEIAADVVAQLRVELLAGVPKVQETHPQAYALYLQARHVHLQGTAEGLEKAIDLYQQSLALDPDSAAAWTRLSSAYHYQAGWGLRPVDDAFRLAREAANRALAVDPNYAPAHCRLAGIASDYDHDLEAEVRHLQRALSLEPTNLIVLHFAGQMLANLGRLDEAIALQKHIVARDPVYAPFHHYLGSHYLAAGRLEEAIASLRTALMLSPSRMMVQHDLGLALLRHGKPEEALAAMQEESFEPYRLIGLVMAYHALGQPAESDAALNDLIEKYEQEQTVNIAAVLADRAEVDRAFRWLDRAMANGESLSGVVADPVWANLHSDPRWLPLLRKVGTPPEELAAIEFDVKLPGQE